MARKIPVGDVMELDLEVPDTSKLSQGLRGPQVQPAPLGAAGPQFNRTSFQGPTQPAATQVLRPGAAPVAEALAAEARAPSVLAKGATGLGRAVGTGLRALGPAAAVAGVLPNFNDYKINDPEVDSSAAGTFRSLRAGDFAGAGRGLSKGMLETGMDVGSALANTADLVVPGKTPVSTAYNQMLRNQFGSQLVDNTAPAQVAQVAQPAAQASPVQPAVRQPFSDARFESQRQGGDPQSPGTVTRNGNSFSGTNIREGFNYADGRKSTGTVSSLDTSAGAAADRAELARNAAARQSAAAAPMGGITGIADDRGLRRRELDMAAKDSKTGMESDAGYERRIAGAVQGLTNFDEAENRLPVETMRNNTTREVNRNNTDTARYMNDQNNATALRGQDREVDERKIQASTAAAAGARAQANSDRQYKLDVYKFGAELEGKDTDRKAAAVKALHDEVGNMLPPGPDGKPDLAKAAAYAQGMNAHLAAQQQAAKAELQRNPNNAAAKSFLENVDKNGVNALGDVGKRKFIAGMQAKELRDQEAGWGPFSGSTSNSAAPIASLRKREGLITDDYDTLDAQGRVTGSIPARAVDRPGSIFGLGGRRDYTYDDLKQR